MWRSFNFSPLYRQMEAEIEMLESRHRHNWILTQCVMRSSFFYPLQDQNDPRVTRVSRIFLLNNNYPKWISFPFIFIMSVVTIFMFAIIIYFNKMPSDVPISRRALASRFRRRRGLFRYVDARRKFFVEETDESRESRPIGVLITHVSAYSHVDTMQAQHGMPRIFVLFPR